MTTINDAYDIIRSHQKIAPVQVVPIAEELGIKVYKESGMPEHYSGRIEKNNEFGGESGYAIYVNANHNVNRRRFTIAHEIAHFVLHRYAIGDGITDDALYRSGLPNFQEVEANNMAADILMPSHLLREHIKPDVLEVEQLARIFQVSNSSMSIRLGVPYEHET